MTIVVEPYVKLFFIGGSCVEGLSGGTLWGWDIFCGIGLNSKPFLTVKQTHRD